MDTGDAVVVENSALGLRVVVADLHDAADADAVLELVDAYSLDPMGAGHPLSASSRINLIPGLRGHPTTVILLARMNNVPVGVAVCFLGFSTFAARPVLNIHDLAVSPVQRGKGIGAQILLAVEKKARELGCCKVTLEVQQENQRARKVYTAAGFASGAPRDDTGSTFFLSKGL